MKALIIAGALGAVMAAGAGAQATGPVAPAGRAPAAPMLLARTGELGLTDAQVVRLAAIARRSQARHQAMRAARDSIRSRFTPGTRPDSAVRAQIAQRLRADAQRMRDQEHADRRDAIAVLSADQQARAWEMVSRRGMGARGNQARPGRQGIARGMRGMRGRAMEPRPMRRPRPDR